MKQIKFGDMLQTEQGILVHGCNAQGVMGSGIALTIKNKYPNAFADYKEFCGLTPMDERLGKTVLSRVGLRLTVANCITQLHFGREGKQYVSYKAIQECFEAVCKEAYVQGAHVHYPLIGAGLGGGDWAIISEIIDTIFAKPEYAHLSRTLWIYE